MPNQPGNSAFDLVERIRARATFVAEAMEEYPWIPDGHDFTGVWAIMRDIAADAKRLLAVVDQKDTPREEVAA